MSKQTLEFMLSMMMILKPKRKSMARHSRTKNTIKTKVLGGELSLLKSVCISYKPIFYKNLI
jgi:hypothetical protein